MLTIMTQTNRAAWRYDIHEGSSNKSSTDRWKYGVDLEKAWVQDRQIERKLFEDLRECTHFTLNKDTFIQVFVENRNANQYRLGQNYGMQHRSNLHHHHGQDSEVDQDFGFCLIKLKWIASNVAECHLGFYQVGPKKRLKFIKNMKKYLNSRQ